MDHGATTPGSTLHPVLARELDYHEQLYSGFAQTLFARPAVRALREHMAGRILEVTGAGRESRVLSLGCGIGDTEMLLAARVAAITGIDLSPAAIRQARSDALRLGITNAHFLEGAMESAAFEPGSFDAVVAVFFLHHLPDEMLSALPSLVSGLLRRGGVFYSLDPSRYRLSGAIGSMVIPHLMRKYQTPDERRLQPWDTAALFRRAGFEARAGFYDFASSPVAGLAPDSPAFYRAVRRVDDVLTRIPLLSRLGSNFEVIARKPVP